MRQILYAMQFRGKAAPANESGTVLKANTTAPSCTIGHRKLNPLGILPIRKESGASSWNERNTSWTARVQSQQGRPAGI